MTEIERARHTAPEKEMLVEESWHMGPSSRPPIVMQRWEQLEAGELRPRAVREELAELREQAKLLFRLANNPSLVALGLAGSTFYQEVRQGYLDAEKSLLHTVERIEAKSHD